MTDKTERIAELEKQIEQLTEITKLQEMENEGRELLLKMNLPGSFSRYIKASNIKEMVEIITEIRDAWRSEIIKYLTPKREEVGKMDSEQARKINTELKKEFDRTFSVDEAARMRSQGNYIIDPKTDADKASFESYLKNQKDLFAKNIKKIYNDFEKRDLRDNLIEAAETELLAVMEKAVISNAIDYQNFVEAAQEKNKDLRSSTDKLLEIESMKLTIRARSNQALQDMAMNENTAGEMNSLQLDLLQAELRSRGLANTADQLETYSEATNAREPYKRDPKYRMILLRASDIDFLGLLKNEIADAFHL